MTICFLAALEELQDNGAMCFKKEKKEGKWLYRILLSVKMEDRIETFLNM